MSIPQDIVSVIEQLPPDLQKEVSDFARYLLDTKVQRKQKYLRMTWADALSDFADQYTSIELQKKSLDWWGD